MNPRYWLRHPKYFITRIGYICKQPRKSIIDILGNRCPDKLFIKVMYKETTGKKLNLKNPTTFNDKLNWLKLYNRNPELTKLVDKVTVKDEVAKIIGERHIVKTYGVWRSFDEIDFDALPDRFVLKTNHDSGGVAICRSKATFDFQAARERLTESLKRDFWVFAREWPYKNVDRRILAEELLVDGSDCIKDQAGCELVTFHAPKAGKRFADAGSGIKKDIVEFFRFVSHKYPLSIPRLYADDKENYVGYLAINTPPHHNTLNTNLLIENLNGWENSLYNEDELRFSKAGSEIRVRIMRNYEELNDYKMFCCNGEVKLIKVDFDRSTNHGANYYDSEWNLTPIQELPLKVDPNRLFPKPQLFAKMKGFGEKISAAVPSPFQRIDFYIVNGKIYFGEITLFPAAGTAQFSPDEWNVTVGEWITLPSKRIKA